MSHTFTLPSLAPVKALAHRTSITATSIDASLFSVSKGSPTRCESDVGGGARCVDLQSLDAGAGAGAVGGGGKPGQVRPASRPQGTDDASATAPAPEVKER